MTAVLPPSPIDLIAVDFTRNVRRSYRIEIGQDLFGLVAVTISWGRIGTKGRSATVVFGHVDEAAAYVQALLRRRASAQKRIGVPYIPLTSLP